MSMNMILSIISSVYINKTNYYYLRPGLKGRLASMLSPKLLGRLLLAPRMQN